jgi:hypothetical protein
VIPGQAYDVSLWAKATPEMGSCTAFSYLNSARPGTPVLNLNGEYQQFTVTYPTTFFKQTAYTFTVVVRCYSGGPGGKVTFDDITMTQVV